MLHNRSTNRGWRTSPDDLIVHEIRSQLMYSTTERYHVNVPVECADASFDFASVFILNQVNVSGYKMALIARVINGVFPDGYFVLALGNSIRHLLGAMRADMGAPSDPESGFANTKVVHPSREHWLSNEVAALYELARKLSYTRIAKPSDESIEKARTWKKIDDGFDDFYNNWPAVE